MAPQPLRNHSAEHGHGTMRKEIPNEDQWYYAEHGERHGSLGTPQMIELIRAGRLQHDTPVWKLGDTDWQLLAASELRAYLPHPPAAPDQPTGRTPGWLATSTPLLVWLLAWSLLCSLILLI